LDKKSDLEKLFLEVKKAGTDEVYVEHMNISKNVRQRLDSLLENENSSICDTFKYAKDNNFRVKLNVLLLDLLKKYDLKIRLGSPIIHKTKSHFTQHFYKGRCNLTTAHKLNRIVS
jgi:hypothetical protein